MKKILLAAGLAIGFMVFLFVLFVATAIVALFSIVLKVILSFVALTVMMYFIIKAND